MWAPAFAGATNAPPQGPSIFLTQALRNNLNILVPDGPLTSSDCTSGVLYPFVVNLSNHVLR